MFVDVVRIFIVGCFMFIPFFVLRSLVSLNTHAIIRYLIMGSSVEDFLGMFGLSFVVDLVFQFCCIFCDTKFYCYLFAHKKNWSRARQNNKIQKYSVMHIDSQT